MAMTQTAGKLPEPTFLASKTLLGSFGGSSESSMVAIWVRSSSSPPWQTPSSSVSASASAMQAMRRSRMMESGSRLTALLGRARVFGVLTSATWENA